MTAHRSPVLLVADVGGTNTRVALADGPVLRTASIARFSNRDYDSLGSVLRAFMVQQSVSDCDAVCAAVAGPVNGTTARLTNRDWDICCADLTEAANAKTGALLNDLQAQGHGVAHMTSDRLRLILPGTPSFDGAPKIVIGVGTGFNIAPIYIHEGRTLVTAAEAGHVSLPVQDAQMLSLATFVAQQHGFADVEEVLSGRGVENVFNWLAHDQGYPKTGLSAAEILQGFETSRDDQTLATAQMFVRCLGIVAGDLALSHLPLGGVYLSGGVARAFAPYLLELGFQSNFQDKGRFSDLMSRFSVQVIEDDFAALLGCAGFLSEGFDGKISSL